MADNVFIFGAGFSYSAGIPLMSAFVDQMWNMARKKKAPDGSVLSSSDQSLLDEAIKIIEELDEFHGRANFDDRNIEDLLSILTFKAMSGGKGSKSNLPKMSRAIARVVELTCKVKRDSQSSNSGSSYEGSVIYKSFWQDLIRMYEKHKSVPTIITFNYDLVLEKSLLALLDSTTYNYGEKRLPFSTFKIDYANEDFGNHSYNVNPETYWKQKMHRGNAFYGEPTKYTSTEQISGYKLSRNSALGNAEVSFPILKLHGSLNFSRRKDQLHSTDIADTDPIILPPVFNKNAADVGNSIWSRAMEELKQAKRIVVVGYSLPRTDVYMQYFLRAALGPNRDLNKISVFDPVLHKNSDLGAALKERYRECFSPQLQRRIDFSPSFVNEKIAPGTTEHFVSLLGSKPDELLFLS
jgi:hypothetical protein